MPPLRRRKAWLVALAGALVVVACGPDDPSPDERDRDDGRSTTTGAEPARGCRCCARRAATSGPGRSSPGVVSVPGGFLAIGERLADDAGGGDVQTVTTFWRSADGRSWTMADADPAVWGEWTADRVAQGPAGIVVLAGGDRGRALVTSADGESWTATEVTAGALGLPADTFPGAFPVNDVAAIDGGFLALGQLIGGGASTQAEPLLLFSPDGASWVRAAGPALAPTAVLPEYFAGAAELDGTTYVFVTAEQGATASVLELDRPRDLGSRGRNRAVRRRRPPGALGPRPRSTDGWWPPATTRPRARPWCGSPTTAGNGAWCPATDSRVRAARPRRCSRRSPTPCS